MSVRLIKDSFPLHIGIPIEGTSEETTKLFKDNVDRAIEVDLDSPSESDGCLCVILKSEEAFDELSEIMAKTFKKIE